METYGVGDMWRLRYGNMETHGNMEKWRHGDMKTWRHGDMETWRHGDTKQKMEAQAIFFNPFTVCSSCKRKFANKLNGLND